MINRRHAERLRMVVTGLNTLVRDPPSGGHPQRDQLVYRPRKRREQAMGTG